MFVNVTIIFYISYICDSSQCYYFVYLVKLDIVNHWCPKQGGISEMWSSMGVKKHFFFFENVGRIFFAVLRIYALF